MIRPVIFLDFDGVLNTEHHQARLATEGKPTKDAWGPLFDPRAPNNTPSKKVAQESCYGPGEEENLRRIIDATDARIVVTSSWRFAHRLGSLRMMWEVRGLPADSLSALDCDSMCMSRGEEIEDWLEEHGRPDYVIIDDLDDFLPSQRPCYVEINPIVGITEADAQKALEILTTK